MKYNRNMMYYCLFFADNNPPQWPITCLVFNVTMNVTAKVKLNATDPDKTPLNFTLSHQPGEGNMTIKDGVLTWTNFTVLEGKNITGLLVYASDGKANVPLAVKVQYCKCNPKVRTCN